MDIFGLIFFFAVAGGMGYFVYTRIMKKKAKKAATVEDMEDIVGGE